MGLSVTFVSGPRRAGKTALIKVMADHLWPAPPHYVRLARSRKDDPSLSSQAALPPRCRVADAQWLGYDDDRVFEVLSDTLSAIHHQDRYGSVVVEADADAVLRHAYPYDHRVFIMPVPADLQEVFRDPERAAVEFRRVLDDTAAFASEIFGLFAGGTDENEPHEDRSELGPGEMRGFLNSPLGDELATRIQLQQAYHGLVESDVIVVNTKRGNASAETEDCLKRLGHLLERTRGTRHSELFVCDPCDPGDKVRRTLIAALKPMCQGGA